MPKSDFKILAIDDEKDILLLLKYNLESEGYIVKTASSGKEGLDIASKYNPDLILIDGGKGQYSVSREVLNELGLHDLPILAVAIKVTPLATLTVGLSGASSNLRYLCDSSNTVIKIFHASG